MKIKDVNIFEQHVEKIVLGVAALGAGYLGWLAIQPVYVDAAGTVTPDRIEDVISDSLAGLQTSINENRLKGAIPVPEQKYADNYLNLVRRTPLDPKFVGNPVSGLAVPQIGPLQIAINGVKTTIDPINDKFRLTIPTPVLPENVRAQAWQKPVAEPSALAAAGGGGVVNLTTTDKNAILIEGYIPIGVMQKDMDSQPAKDNKRLPDVLRKAAVYRIQVQRHERTPTGWTVWKDVAPAKGNVAPPTEIDFTNLAPDPMSSLSVVDAEFKQIVLPDFYLDEAGQPNVPTIIKEPTQKSVLDRLKKMMSEPGPGGVGATPAPTADPATVTLSLPTSADPANPVTVDLNQFATQIKTMPIVPFAFWDEDVKQGPTYQYRVRTAFINPTFKSPWGLANPAMAKVPLLTSDWVVINTPVEVHPDVVFFVSGAGRDPKQVSFRIFKLTSGKWYFNEHTFSTGTGIQGNISLVNQAGKTVAVDTGYKLIDAVPVNNGGDIHVVLQDSTGKLITRDAKSDLISSQDFLNKAEKIQAKSTTQPAGTVFTTPTTPGTGSVRPPGPIPPGSGSGSSPASGDPGPLRS